MYVLRSTFQLARMVQAVQIVQAVQGVTLPVRSYNLSGALERNLG